MTDQVIHDLRSLAAMLEKPEPGLASWHMACETVWQRIQRELGDSAKDQRIKELEASLSAQEPRG